MQANINHPRNNEDNPEWYFIAEFLLDEDNFGEFLGTELPAFSLFQAMLDRGIPSQSVKRIKGAIAETCRGVRGSFNHTLPDLPVRIYVFSNKKTVDRPHHSGDQMNGGWGFYMIERGGDFHSPACQEHLRVMELYLFKEGE